MYKILKRFAFDKLFHWKADKKRKPLVIRGARNVGKTRLACDFGSTFYKNTVRIGFETDPVVKDLFGNDYDIHRIITGIEVAYNTKIDPAGTLLIFDEIQEVPAALDSLKYFYEKAPEYHIIATSSLPVATKHGSTPFPVGTSDSLELYPLSFKEFLGALGKDNLLEGLNENDPEMSIIFKNEYIDRLKEYFFVGGLPEAVNDFVKNRDFGSVREIQNKILRLYEFDYLKHAPNKEVPRVRVLFDSIPTQLAKENKKFFYGLLRKGARAGEYETALNWLSGSGLTHKKSRISRPDMPLNTYEDLKAFKLYMPDIGLLSNMIGLDAVSLLKGNNVFSDFNGALTEQFIYQQLKQSGNMPLYYWTNDKGNAEIDFVVQPDINIIPIDAKLSKNLNAKSLKVYREYFKPEIAVRISLTEYKKQDGLMTLPLYSVEKIVSL